MTKPDDVPQDVWDTAMEVYDPAAPAIAQAILAERERCASVVEDWGQWDESGFPISRLAAAIREGR